MRATILSLAAAAALLCAASAHGQVPDSVDVPVLARAIDKGEVISLGDLALEPRAPGLARGALPPDAVIGMEATRRLAMGSVLRQPDVGVPEMIRRGDRVRILLRKDGLSIATTGRALSGGGQGNPIRVVCDSTNRTLDATVAAPGVASMPLP